MHGGDAVLLRVGCPGADSDAKFLACIERDILDVQPDVLWCRFNSRYSYSQLSVLHVSRVYSSQPTGCFIGKSKSRPVGDILSGHNIGL